MQPFTVLCFRPTTRYPHHAIYILSHGNNAGRPSFAPHRNCFVLIAEPDHVAAYYALVNILWNHGQFKLKLRGSVIPFVTIGDVKELIRKSIHILPTIEQQMPLLQQLTQLEELLHQQIYLVQCGRKQLYQQLFIPAT